VDAGIPGLPAILVKGTMKHLSRVVWNEGMYLAQHHFQVQSRYFEDSLRFALAHLFFKSYGLAGCELDRETLLNGTVSLIHARGVLPDGLPFHMPDSDPLPPALEIRNLFSPTQESHHIYLTIPAYRPGAANCAATPSEADSARYVAETTLVRDDITGSDEKPVAIGRKNFRLQLDLGLAERDVALPLARVRRDGAGHFVYDPEYIPPCLQIGASETLLLLLRRLVEILEAKSVAIEAERKGGRHQELREYASQEVANFWLLHAVRSSMAPLRHQLELKHSHPEQLYAELARLAGALCTFALDSDPRSLPPYDHERLGECFGALDRHIRSHLEIIIPTNCITIPLKQASEFLYIGAVTDQRCFGRSSWVLGIQSELPRAEVMTNVPSRVKICSSQHVERLFRDALPGLTLQHLSSPPSAISPRIGTEYFSIGRTGTHSTQVCWKLIADTREVGVYVPAALRGSGMELSVVLET
jgi:type VI secretion system protein ImpJ